MGLERDIRQILAETCRGEIHAATAGILALITAARRPDGWVMVPREPTEAMHEAALDQLGRNPDRPDEEIEGIYRALLSAAPKKEPDHG